MKPYKSNKLTVTQELAKLPNGVCDTVELLSGNSRRDTKRVGIAVFDGSADENWVYMASQSVGNTAYFYIYIASANKDIISDKFIYSSNLSLDKELIKNEYGQIIIRVNKSRLTTLDAPGFKTWLVANHVTVQYELATPVETILPDQKLTTYKGITNIFTTANPQPYLTANFKSRLGNSVDVLRGMPATNLVTNGDFRNGTVGWDKIGLFNPIVLNNIYSFTVTAAYHKMKQSISFISLHKYYICVYVKADNKNVFLEVYCKSDTSANIAHSGSNTFERLSYIATAGSGANSHVGIIDARSGAWTEIQVKYFSVLDLTEIFGTGNEPTLAEMDAIMSKYPNSWFDGTVNPLLTHKELMTYLNKNKANVKQEDWITPTLLNGWVAFDTPRTPKYCKDTIGNVKLTGLIKSGTVSTVMFTLPAGYRPSSIITFGVSSNNAYGQVFIDSNGSVTCSFGSNTWVSLNGITFRAEA
jgi:hypothetical protein